MPFIPFKVIFILKSFIIVKRKIPIILLCLFSSLFVTYGKEQIQTNTS